MIKYKLLKELPLAPVGTEVHTLPSGLDIAIFLGDTFLANINEKDIPLWLEEIKKKKSVWDIQNGDKYYTIYRSYPNTWNSDIYDIGLRDVGNCFLTLSEVEKEIKKRKAIVKLNRIIDEKNGDWIPNWKNGDETKYGIYYHRYANIGVYIVSYNTSSTYSNTIKYAKDKSIMESIIDNHKDLLDIVFDIN